MDTIYTVIIKEKLEDCCESNERNDLVRPNYYRNEAIHDMLSFSSTEQLLKYLHEIKDKKVESKLYNEDYKDFIRHLVGGMAVRIAKSSDEIWKNLEFYHKQLGYNMSDLYESSEVVDGIDSYPLCIVCTDLRGPYKLNYPTPNSTDQERNIVHMLLIYIYKNDLIHNDTERVEHHLVKNLEEN